MVKKKQFNPTGFSKPIHVIIEPSKMHKNEEYAFTFNPNFQSPHYGVKRIEETYAYIVTALRGLNQLTTKYSVIFELSKLGRLHVHGYISTNDIANFYACQINWLTKHGSVSVVPIDWEDDGHVIWKQYLNKDRHIMEPFMIKNKMSYVVDNININKLENNSHTATAGFEAFAFHDCQDDDLDDINTL